MIDRRTLVQLTTAAVASGVGPRLARAQSYPTHAVRIIVPFAPGGPPDIVARALAQKLSERLGQQFVIENLPGAGGNRGIATASRAAPDGYTLLVISTGFFVNPSLYPKVPYDPFKSFAPISLVAASPNVLMVHPSVPAKSVREFIDLVKASPGKYSYGHPATGSAPHLFGELLKLRFGLDIATVAFTAGPPAIMSTIGGHTPIAITSLPPALASVREGSVRALAVTSAQRLASLPDVPTMAESGVDGLEAETLNGVLAPVGTPREIVFLLNSEIAKIMAMPDVAARLTGIGFRQLHTTPDEFTARIAREVAKWGQVVRDAKIKVEGT